MTDLTPEQREALDELGREWRKRPPIPETTMEYIRAIRGIYGHIVVRSVIWSRVRPPQPRRRRRR